LTDLRLRVVASTGLIIGAVLGMAGTFAPSASLRGLAWGIDGTALIVSAALLTVHHLRRGNDLAAAGFLVFAVGETLLVSGAAATLEASIPSFGAGVALWAAALILVSSSGTMPLLVRAGGLLGGSLFTLTALQIFSGVALTPLSQPLPFVAYPFLAATLFGWAWVHYRDASRTRL
jgi:hypothetical protein